MLVTTQQLWDLEEKKCFCNVNTYFLYPVCREYILKLGTRKNKKLFKSKGLRVELLLFTLYSYTVYMQKTGDRDEIKGGGAGVGRGMGGVVGKLWGGGTGLVGKRGGGE